MIYKIHTDGGARGNPGPAAVGVVIEEVKEGQTSLLIKFGKCIGKATNNVAEYRAVVEALTYLHKLRQKNQTKESPGVSVHCFLDSLLVASQLQGVYKVKDATLRELFFHIKTLEATVDIPIFYEAVRRDQNKDADLMVNLALDRAR